MPVPVKVVVRSLLLAFSLEPEPPAKSHANPNVTPRLAAAILSAAKDLLWKCQYRLRMQRPGKLSI